LCILITAVSPKGFSVQSTKDNILAYLKRNGGAGVDAVASEFGLARMTVRQHLSGLERDRLVASREERGRTGRPHLLFTLTTEGEERFPKRYDRLADLALEEVAALTADEIAGLGPDEKKRLLLKKMAERVYREHEPRVRNKELKERVAIIADILRQEGGFAEWRTEGQRRYEIVDYNCVYRKVAGSQPDVCDWHLSLLGRLLGKDVECAQFMSQGAECCRFVVNDDVASGVTSGEARQGTDG
jgi:predicted ArsR family transcriptional regulator